MLLAAAMVPFLLMQTNGLEIKTVTAGKGPAAKVGDRITVEYTGKLLDGKQFDSSKGRAPFTLTLGAGQVIKGWDQGLVGAKLGEKRTLRIPADLAYGDRAAGDIPPGSTLDFEIDVLLIEAKGAKPKVTIVNQAPGDGAAAKDGQNVTIHYTGTFLNGVKFDSSRDRGQGFTFRLGGKQVIPGFDEAVRGMKIGGKRKATIPPELAYGPRGAGGVIPPNATIVFEVELLGISK